MSGFVPELADAFSAAGLPRGVPLVVHTGMGALAGALRQRGIGEEEIRAKTCPGLADALESSLGSDGTICVPGYFYDYARRGLAYDARTAEPDSTLGIFPRWFLRNRMRFRSLNPLLNIMTAGARAEWIAHLPSLYGYGPNSPWGRMVEADGWMMFFGTTPATNTFTHHVEQLVGVPHLYNKIYRVPVTGMDGRLHDGSICAVRYLDPRFPVDYVLGRYGEELLAAGLMRRTSWEGVDIYLAPLRAVQVHLQARLLEDPFALLGSVPTFVRGALPDDGPDWARQD